MTSRLSLLAGLALMAGFSAFAEEPETAEDAGRATEADELSVNFREFVDEAIGEGLLTPADQAPVSASAPSEPTQLFRGRLSPTDAAAPVEVDSACISDAVLDLQAFEEFSTYEHFLNWRAEQVATGISLTPADVAMAYVSIGLYAEGRLQVSGMEDTDSRYIRNLSRLLEDGSVPDIELFEQVAACNMYGDIWLSLARLSLLDKKGVDLLDLNLMSYRRLPYRLKVRTASLAIPSLDRMGKTLLSEKLMADFSAEEIRRSQRLAFTRAMIDMNQGGIERERQLREFLNVPELRSETAAVLMRHGLPVEESAARFAGNIGLLSVMTALSEDIPDSEGLTSERAALAFRMQDFASLRDLTQTRSDNPDVMRLAAMAAVLTNDRAWLAKVASRVVLDTPTVVDLIETDAASGNWILPAAVYSAAERITQEDYRPRIDAVLALKFGKAEPRLQRIKLSEIPEHLSQISAALNSNFQEMP